MGDITAVLRCPKCRRTNGILRGDIARQVIAIEIKCQDRHCRQINLFTTVELVISERNRPEIVGVRVPPASSSLVVS